MVASPPACQHIDADRPAGGAHHPQYTALGASGGDPLSPAALAGFAVIAALALGAAAVTATRMLRSRRLA